MFKGIVRFIDASDTYTKAHSSNVVIYVKAMLEKIDCSEFLKKDIIAAANLHDIGKLGIPEHILNKPGKLTESEYEKMKLHPMIGSDLIRAIKKNRNISEMVKHHHERADGKGYPEGLKENQIPLGSKIIAIAVNGSQAGYPRQISQSLL